MIDPDKVAAFIIGALGRDSKQSVHEIHAAAIERWPDLSHPVFGAGLVLAFAGIQEAVKKYGELEFELDEIALEVGRHWRDCGSVASFLTTAASSGKRRAQALIESKFWLRPLLERHNG